MEPDGFVRIVALRGLSQPVGADPVTTARHDYRQKAADCLLAAERAHDPAEKMKLLEIAQQWMALAEHITNVIASLQSVASPLGFA